MGQFYNEWAGEGVEKVERGDWRGVVWCCVEPRQSVKIAGERQARDTATKIIPVWVLGLGSVGLLACLCIALRVI